MHNKCLVCGCSNTRVLFTNIKNTNYGLLQCTICDFAWINPVPTAADLQKYYSSVYYKGKIDDAFVAWKRQQDNYKFNALISDIENNIKPSTLLEIGCAYGLMLEIAQLRGWMVTGFEYSVPVATYARQRLGINVFHGGIDNALKLNQKFGAIVLSHVLEHLVDPKEDIQKLKQLISKNGILAFRLPNFHSFTFWLHQNQWFWLSPPEHIYYFNPKNLKKLLQDYGFEIVRLTTTEGDYVSMGTSVLFSLVNKLGWYSKLRKMLKKDRAALDSNNFSPFAIYPLVDKIDRFARIFSFVFFPLVCLLNYLKLGSEIYVIAKKKND